MWITYQKAELIDVENGKTYNALNLGAYIGIGA